MNYIDRYLAKNAFHPRIKESPGPNLNYCVVIPCFNEPDIILSLISLYNCTRPKKNVEIIILINAPENCSEKILRQNEETFNVVLDWINKHKDPIFTYHVLIDNHLPKKHAGVGLARKIGMDEAVSRFHKINNPNGIILGFDADSVCDANYFTAVEEHFTAYPRVSGASIYFEHPIDDSKTDPKLLNGIIQYELHLRYLVEALRFTGHPHAFHTVGSSFAVKTDEYVRQGGMNKRQAGEDFYFLQKIITLGKFSEINTTRIIPSPRVSDRVPFGTGASMKKWIESDNQFLKTYNFKTFQILKSLFSLVEFFYKSDTSAIENKISELDISLVQFLHDNNYLKEIESIKQNTSGLQSFRNRFFNWFNAFRVIKYLNFATLKEIETVRIKDAALNLINIMRKEKETEMNEKELLIFYRNLERGR